MDARPAVILVDRSDPARRRIFTIFHEYAHVLLNDGGVCPAGGAQAGGGGGAPDIERWCDRFAGAALMPRDKFWDALRDARGAGGDPLRVATDLSNRFCVSRAAAAARAACVLDDAGLKEEYSRCHGALSRETKKRGGGRGPTDRTGRAAGCIARKGRRYASLVADASEAGAISTSTALDYLEIKLKSLDELKMRCKGGQSAEPCCRHKIAGRLQRRHPSAAFAALWDKAGGPAEAQRPRGRQEPGRRGAIARRAGRPWHLRGRAGRGRRPRGAARRAGIGRGAGCAQLTAISCTFSTACCPGSCPW